MTTAPLFVIVVFIYYKEVKMGIYAYDIGKMDIPEEHREEWARQVLKILRAGGMMAVEELRLYRKKIYLLLPPELNEDGWATGYYNYFEKSSWENRGTQRKARHFFARAAPLTYYCSRYLIPYVLRKELSADFCIYSICFCLLFCLAAPAEVNGVGSLNDFEATFFKHRSNG